jgi:hypothetical protein
VCGAIVILEDVRVSFLLLFNRCMHILGGKRYPKKVRVSIKQIRGRIPVFLGRWRHVVLAFGLTVLPPIKNKYR